jgi:hypothetical protein
VEDPTASDADLLRAAADGQREAFELLCRGHPPLISRLRYRCADEALIGDVVRETFLDLATDRDVLRDRDRRRVRLAPGGSAAAADRRVAPARWRADPSAVSCRPAERSDGRAVLVAWLIGQTGEAAAERIWAGAAETRRCSAWIPAPAYSPGC